MLVRQKSVTVIECHSIRSFFGPKKCLYSRSVTLTGVSVSGEACIPNTHDDFSTREKGEREKAVVTSRRETPSYALHDYPHQTSAFMPRGWEKMQYFRIHSLNLTGPQKDWLICWPSTIVNGKLNMHLCRQGGPAPPPPPRRLAHVQRQHNDYDGINVLDGQFDW